MQYKQRFSSTIGILAVVMGLTACTSKAPEPEPTPKMSNDELDRLVTAKINGDAGLAVYKLDVDADADRNTPSACFLSCSISRLETRSHATM